MNATKRHSDRFNRWLEWLSLLALLLAFGGYLAYGQYDDYLQIDRHERERLGSQAAVIEKNLVPHLVSANTALENLREQVPRWLGERDGWARASRRLKIFSATLPGLRVMLIVDAQGRIVASNNETLLGANLSEREWFQLAARQNQPRTLYVVAPAKTLLNTYAMALVRSMSGPAGEFSGAVYASLDPDFATTLLDSVRYMPDATSSLMHGDGRLFIRTPEQAGGIGQDMATPGSAFSRHGESALAANVYADKDALSGDERLVALRTVQPAELAMDKALVVGVARDLNALFSPWRKSAIDEGALFLVLVCIACLSLYLYQRRQRVFERLGERQRRALQASEARLFSFFDASPDALLISDAQGYITMANRQVERLLGYSVAELLGRPIEDLVPGRFKAHHPALRSAFAASPRSRRMGHGLAVRARRKDGSECDVEVSLSRIETDDGLFFASALRDITERNRSEEQLRIAAAAFESQEGIVVTDAHSVILRANRAFMAMTGYTEAELVGRTPRMFKSDRHGADFFRDMWERIHRTGGWQGEVWDRRKNGDVYPNWLTISTVKGEDGAVTHYVGTNYDITERKQAQEKINALAFYDQLTGLPNRTLLQDRLKQAKTVSGRSDQHAALLFIDLDNFKTLNDTLGHDTGDLLLKQVAQRLTLCVREGDTVARLGGDEFVVILSGLGCEPGSAASLTEAVATKIMETLNQVYRFGNVAHHSTASIGATLFKGPLISIDELLKQADLTMYRAKAAGRNTVRFFDPAMEAAVKQRAELEVDLRRAVDARQFELHYQVQVGGRGHVTGAEVLVRWLHPERGMVAPGDFIALAEETGLIVPLGHWVLDVACRQLAVWAGIGERAHWTVAVNVSAHQFRRGDFVGQVLAVLQSTGANPHRLKLELTESLLIDNVGETVEKMSRLKAMGVGFSLDDFGTGYSSLSYLKRLPLEQLKIDRSFVNDVLTNANDAAIAKTIVALAHSLGLGVIAEGVETEAQRVFLAEHGCHAYQGYHFGRPLPVEQFEALARTISEGLQ